MTGHNLGAFMNRFFVACILLLLSSLSVAATQVVVDTNRGRLVIELFDKEAPETVANFLRYVDKGHYNGTIFHRVIPNFMIQGGGFTKEFTQRKTDSPIKNEAKETLKNVRGTIAMARLSAPDSATSQFFINTNDNPSLDWRKFNMGYAVFGKVVQGMEVADEISYVDTGEVGLHRDVPIDAVEIIKIYRVQVQD